MHPDRGSGQRLVAFAQRHADALLRLDRQRRHDVRTKRRDVEQVRRPAIDEDPLLDFVAGRAADVYRAAESGRTDVTTTRGPA